MSYATLIVALADQPAAATVNSKEVIAVRSQLQGRESLPVALHAPAGSAAAEALQGKTSGDLLIASGDVTLADEGSIPLITASVVCGAHADQYLNEVCIVGRIGSDSRTAESGKSTKRSIAVNRYRRDPATGEVLEETDWYGIRAFGFLKEKLERFDKGALIEVAGVFAPMTNAAGNTYCEVRARSIRAHKGGKGGANPAAGTTAAGYDQSAFMGSPDDIGDSSDWA